MEQTETNQRESTEETKAEIREQLERVLTSSYFNHSRRIPAFLKFVVERALSGQTELLKERTLGIEVFGREADYDTGSDSIVRVTAAELRKRIAQYYLEPGHDNELRISLPPGTYIPHFQWPDNIEEEDDIQPAVVPPLLALPAEKDLSSHKKRFRYYLRFAAYVALAVTAILAIGIMLDRRSVLRASSVNSFWTPVLTATDPVLFCIGDQNQHVELTLLDADDTAHQVTLPSGLNTVVIDDLGPIVRIGSILQANGKRYSIKGGGSTTLVDLRNGPTVYVGAFDNAWTLWITKSLRYRFANNQELTEFGIADSTHPGPMRWKIGRQEQAHITNYRDYAIVARFTDPTTGQLSIVAAGAGSGGTVAAGEFLSNPDDLAQITRDAGGRKNMEIVLSTLMVNGASGSPRVEAAYYW